MILEVAEPNWFRTLAKRAAASRLGSWFLSRTLHYVDRVVLKLSGGRTCLSALCVGLPVLTVTTRGARTGKPRGVPLLGVPEGRTVILIASNWGRTFHPSWYWNLRAHPDVMVSYKGETREYFARETPDMEREASWRRAVELYPGYEAYRLRAGARRFPVFLLTPKVA